MARLDLGIDCSGLAIEPASSQRRAARCEARPPAAAAPRADGPRGAWPELRGPVLPPPSRGANPRGRRQTLAGGKQVARRLAPVSLSSSQQPLYVGRPRHAARAVGPPECQSIYQNSSLRPPLELLLLLLLLLLLPRPPSRVRD